MQEHITLSLPTNGKKLIMEQTAQDKKPLPESVLKELAALAEKSDEDIDFSDIPATTHADWVGAVRGKFYRPDRQIMREAD